MMSMLDEIIFSSALAQARRFVERGLDAEKAAEHACPGAWAVYRERVLAKLLDEQKRDRLRDKGP